MAAQGPPSSRKKTRPTTVQSHKNVISMAYGSVPPSGRATNGIILGHQGYDGTSVVNSLKGREINKLWALNPSSDPNSQELSKILEGRLKGLIPPADRKLDKCRRNERNAAYKSQMRWNRIRSRLTNARIKREKQEKALQSGKKNGGIRKKTRGG